MAAISPNPNEKVKADSRSAWTLGRRHARDQVGSDPLDDASPTADGLSDPRDSDPPPEQFAEPGLLGFFDGRELPKKGNSLPFSFLGTFPPAGRWPGLTPGGQFWNEQWPDLNLSNFDQTPAANRAQAPARLV